jgi:hypothetical protein
MNNKQKIATQAERSLQREQLFLDKIKDLTQPISYYLRNLCKSLQNGQKNDTMKVSFFSM